MTVNRLEEAQASLKSILIIVTLCSMIAGGGGSWVAIKMSVSGVKKEQIRIEAESKARDKDLDGEVKESDTRQRAIMQSLSRIEGQLNK